MSIVIEEKKDFPIELLDKLHTSGAGYDILRYFSLPNLLGSEADTILYFMGKELARTFNIQSFDDIYTISEKLGWGKMELFKERRNYLVFTLMADAVFHRLKAPLILDFRLEAGFLSEAIYRIKGIDCECTETIHRKIYQVQFKVVYT